MDCQVKPGNDDRTHAPRPLHVMPCTNRAEKPSGPCAIAHHMRRAEMDRKQQRIVRRAGFQQAPARHRGVVRPLVRHVVPMRRVDLQCVMDDVAAEDGASARIREPEQDMAGRMAGRSLDRQLGGDVVAVVDQHGLARLHHREHAVLVSHVTRVGGHRRILPHVPVGVVGARKQVLCVRERRHPAPVAQHRIPADVVGMQVRAQHQVDVLGRDAGGAQALQIRRVELMEAMRPRPVLVIAAAGIEQDGQIARTDQPRVHAGHEAVVLRAVVIGRQPVEVTLQHVALEVAEIFLARLVGDAELLFHPRDRGRADGPCAHRVHVLIARSPVSSHPYQSTRFNACRTPPGRRQAWRGSRRARPWSAVRGWPRAADCRISSDRPSAAGAPWSR